MKEHDVEVAVRAKGASPIAPDRKKSQVTCGFSHGTVGQGGEPFVSLGGVGPAEFVTLEVEAGEEPSTSFPERRVRAHCGNVALGL
jgi:hypothetical protein